MPSLARSGLSWARQQLAWSNSRRSWQERLGIAVLLTAAGCLLYFRSKLALSHELLAWSFLLLCLAVLLRRGWLKLFGPVLLFELVRYGRHRRAFVFRCLYALFLMLLLCWVYLIELLESSHDGQVPAEQMANFAALFFYWFIGLQFATVVVLTPAFTAGAIAEEKERRTLEFLFATDLRDREIVFSKVASRLGSLTLVLLTGLPILSLLQFLGGVDPNLLLAGFACTGLTMFSLGGLSVFISVWARKARDAIALSYLTVVAYFILSGSCWLLMLGLGAASFPSTEDWTSPIVLEDVVKVLNAGNPIAALLLLVEQVDGGGRLDDAVPAMLRDYALFHGGLGIGLIVWAVLCVRAVSLKQLSNEPAKGALRQRIWQRPRVGSRPMLWKEIFAEPGLNLNWFGRILIALLVIISFAPAIWICGFFVSEFVHDANLAWEELGQAMNAWARIVGTIVACLLLMAVAVRAASSISGERDRQTLDSLLTSPLDSTTILFAKWAGSILSVRWACIWLGLIWGLSLATGGLHPLALPGLLVAWLIFAAFVASLGLWFSLVSRTSLRATVWTLSMIVFLSIGHLFVASLCFYMPIALLATGWESELDMVPQFHLFGLTPPLTLGYLAMQGWEFEVENFLWSTGETWRYIGFAAMGLVCWLVASAAVFGLTGVRFRAMSGRQPLAKPKRPPAESPPMLTVVPVTVMESERS